MYSRTKLASSSDYYWHTWSLFEAIAENFEYIATLEPEPETSVPEPFDSFIDL